MHTWTKRCAIALAVVAGLVACGDDASNDGDTGIIGGTTNNGSTSFNSETNNNASTNNSTSATNNSTSATNNTTGTNTTGTPIARGDRRLGLDINAAAEAPGGAEPFTEAFELARGFGINYTTFPLNWSAIEPGPDDRFEMSVLDPSRWMVVSGEEALSVSDGALRWEGSEARSAALVNTYTFDPGSLSLRAQVETHSGDTSEGDVTLLLTVGDEAPAGGECDAPDDHFIALVWAHTPSGGAVVAARCLGGSFEAPELIEAPGTRLGLQARRTDDAWVLEVTDPDDPTRSDLVARWPLSELGAAFEGRARPHLFMTHTSGAPATVAVHDWALEDGWVRFDDPNQRYSADPNFDILDIANTFYGSVAARQGVSVDLSIRTINTVTTELPSDLQRLIDPSTGKIDFSDPRIQTRYASALAHIFARTPDIHYTAVSLGNEIDVYLGDDARAWDQYAGFIEAVLPLARDHFAQTYGPAAAPFGVKATFHGVVDPGAVALDGDTWTQDGPSVKMEHMRRLVAASDAMLVTYYPIHGDFTVMEPDVVHTHFDQLDDLYATGATASVPIFLQEVGYPSASASAECGVCNSSEEQQARFFRETFAAWDDHATRITALNINWFSDVGQATLDVFGAYYGIQSPAFLGYLGTLGLRHPDGTPKAAFHAVRDEAQRRGWSPQESP